MVRNYQRKSDRGKQYNKEDFDKVLDEVQRGCMTMRQASEKYGIPYQTIQNHISGKRGTKSKTQGRSTVIPPDQEERLAQCLTVMERWGWGLSRKEVLEIVGLFVKKNSIKTPFKNGVPGEDWFLAFKRRHNLSIKKPQTLEFARKKAGMDPFVIEKYFDILDSSLKSLKLADKPSQVYNIDETSFNLDPSKTKVVGEKNSPSVRVTSGPGKESTTVLMGGSASGHKLPPLIVFKGKNVWDTWMAPTNQSFPEMSYAASTNGWMEADIFYNYFRKTFLKFCTNKRPLLLVYDGHTTHVDERTIKCALDNNITILKLPPHTSHLLQPMDLAVFKSIKTAWDSKVAYFQRHNQGHKINKREFSILISEIWTEASPDLLISGFRKSGISPFNRNVINKSAYDPEAYRRYNLELLQRTSIQQHDQSQEEQNRVDPNQEDQDREKPSTSSCTLINVGLPLNEFQMDECRQSSVTQARPAVNDTFESLLLSTVKQFPQTPKMSRKKVGPGAEIITTTEYLKKKQNDKENQELEKKRKVEERNKKIEIKKLKNQEKSSILVKTSKKREKEKQKKFFEKQKMLETDEESESDPDQLFSDEDSDVPNVEDLAREIVDEEKERAVDETYCSSRDIEPNHWVLVKFLTKKKSLHFVGQVTSKVSSAVYEVMFLRKIKSDGKGTTFNWPENQDIHFVDSQDMVLVLPEPSLGRRGELHFAVSFSSYNLQ